MAEILYAADSTIYETVRDTIVTGLEAIDWTDVSPLISNVYDGHSKADMAFNAVSVGLTAADREHSARKSSPSGSIINHGIQVELRIHTAVAGRNNDSEKFWRLANSISNWLGRHTKLAAGLHITEPGQIEDDLTFEESDTVGGSIVFTVLYTAAHEAA